MKLNYMYDIFIFVNVINGIKVLLILFCILGNCYKIWNDLIILNFGVFRYVFIW